MSMLNDRNYHISNNEGWPKRKYGWLFDVILVILVAFVIFLFSFRSEKKYAMQFNQGEVINIMNVINQSNAPHLEVLEAQKTMGREIQPYLDSLGRLK